MLYILNKADISNEIDDSQIIEALASKTYYKVSALNGMNVESVLLYIANNHKERKQKVMYPLQEEKKCKC